MSSVEFNENQSSKESFSNAWTYLKRSEWSLLVFAGILAGGCFNVAYAVENLNLGSIQDAADTAVHFGTEALVTGFVAKSLELPDGRKLFSLTRGQEVLIDSEPQVLENVSQVPKASSLSQKPA